MLRETWGKLRSREYLPSFCDDDLSTSLFAVGDKSLKCLSTSLFAVGPKRLILSELSIYLWSKMRRDKGLSCWYTMG